MKSWFGGLSSFCVLCTLCCVAEAVNGPPEKYHFNGNNENNKLKL